MNIFFILLRDGVGKEFVIDETMEASLVYKSVAATWNLEADRGEVRTPSEHKVPPLGESRSQRP